MKWEQVQNTIDELQFSWHAALWRPLSTLSSFCVVGAALHTCRIACSTLHTPHSTVHSPHSTLYTSHSTRYLRLTRLPRHDRGPVPEGNRSAASCCLCTVLRRASYHYATRSPDLCTDDEMGRMLQWCMNHGKQEFRTSCKGLDSILCAFKVVDNMYFTSDSICLEKLWQCQQVAKDQIGCNIEHRWPQIAVMEFISKRGCESIWFLHLDGEFNGDG